MSIKVNYGQNVENNWLKSSLLKINIKEKTRVGLLILLDILLLNISTILAYELISEIGLVTGVSRIYSIMLQYVIISTGIKIGVFRCFRLYRSLWRYAGLNEILLVSTATFASNAVLIIINLAWPMKATFSIIIISFFIDTFLIGGIRFSYRATRKFMKYGFHKFKDCKKVLVVGGGDAGSTIIKELKLNKELNSTPVAVIDDDMTKIGRDINGVKIIGNRYKIAYAVEKYGIDEIIIAIPSAPNGEINKIFSECSKTSCKVKILPSVCQLIDGSVSIRKVREINIEDLLGREPVKLDIDLISSYLKDKVILVTGGGGSIGSELCRQIACYGPKMLIIIDNYENNAYEIQNELLHKHPDLNLTVIIASIRDRKRIDSIFQKYRPQVVFHAAAHKHVPLMESCPTEAIKNNVFGTQNVAECANKYGADKFVLISTDKAVNPTNIMGATKRIAEMIIQAYNKHSNTEFVAVRFGNVLGSNGSVIPLFKKQIDYGGPVTVTHPEVTRFFMTIAEAAQLVIEAGGMAKGGEIFVLDMGEPVKILDLARNLIKMSGFEPEVDIKIEFTGLRPGEKLYEELLLKEENLLATRNNKIFIAQPIYTDLQSLKKEIRTLSEIIMNNSDEVINYIPNIVPTYRKCTAEGKPDGHEAGKEGANYAAGADGGFIAYVNTK